MHIKLGADPETFLRVGGEFVSAAGLLPGTKKEPFKVDKGAVQVDGLAFEYNIDAASSEDEFNNNHRVVLAQMDEMIKKIDKDMELVFTPYAEFDQEYFTLLPYDCKILGCDPDFNYLGKQKKPPSDLEFRPFRTAAGHIHIGWTEGEKVNDPAHFEDARFIASKFFGKGMFRPQNTPEKKRIRYYGGDGAFRPKSYGVELRSPSNLWVEHEETRRQTYRDVMKTMEELGA